MSIKPKNALIGKHFYNSLGWHTVEAEVSTGCFMVASTSRKGQHVSRRIWRTQDIAPFRLYLNETDMHDSELESIREQVALGGGK